MTTIPDGITAQDVREALAALDRDTPHQFGQSTGYDLIYGGRRYPPKAVLGLAATRLLGHPLGPYDFKGGEQSHCFQVLRRLGFTIEPKPQAQEPGADWNEVEIRALVEDYFDMLAREVAGTTYSKTVHRNGLMRQLTGRSKGSIEYKYQNVSGVLSDLGFVSIDGYKPAKNYQKNLLPDIVREHLGSNTSQIKAIEAALDHVADELPLPKEFSDCEVSLPKVPSEPSVSGHAPRPTREIRLVREYDFAARDAANRRLGSAGEAFIVERERWYLNSLGRSDLATRVEQVSQSQGDGLGYDIVSFDPTDLAPIYIEVKTTNQRALFPFLLSANEYQASIRLGDRYRLYRVFNFSSKPSFYQVSGSLESMFELAPTQFRARRR
jgi:hypothetical protein